MRVLFVEDEEGIVDFVKKTLESNGYSFDSTPSGEKGVFLAKTNDYDIILLDAMLPGIDGFEVCRQIREVKKKVPIMMLTVKSETKDKVSALNMGADDYLTKPFALEELLARIHALLRRPQTPQEEIMRYGDLVVDTQRRVATLKGKVLDLRLKEFALLEYLMKHRGIVQTRSMLLEHVWDMSVDPFTNTVDVHIRTLRRKLNDEVGRIIQTSHGIGYKIG